MSTSIIVSIVFFVILYASICFYIGFNLWVWLNSLLPIRKKLYFIIPFILLASSLFWSQLLTTIWALHLVGFYWLVIVGYCLFLLPVVNVILYIIKRKTDSSFVKQAGILVLSFFVFVFTYGSFNAWNPVVREYDITTNHEIVNGELTILMVSDLHLGPIVGERHLSRLVSIASNIEPDMVLISGDIINDSIDPFTINNMGTTLRKLQAPLGVFAAPGNHDYYGGDIVSLYKEMNKAGITLLEDEVTFINQSIQVIGRIDKSQPRQPLSDLVDTHNKEMFTILLDHQPYFDEETKDLGIDLVLSGHTHRGQLVPGHFITNLLYEIDWGYLLKDQTHIFVSSGFGTWGPPLRIGSRSEVKVVTVHP